METLTQNLRAKAIIEKMVANGGKSTSWAQAMRDAGYSESYARNPQKIKNTKLWREYMEQFFPDNRLVRTHKNLLEAQKISRMDFPVELNDKDIEKILTSSGHTVLAIRRSKLKVRATFAEPDFSIRFKATDMAYKIKGLYNQK